MGNIVDFVQLRALPWAVQESGGGGALWHEAPVPLEEAVDPHVTLVDGHDRDALVHEVREEARDPLPLLIIGRIQIASHGRWSGPEAHVEVVAQHIGDRADGRCRDERGQRVLQVHVQVCECEAVRPVLLDVAKDRFSHSLPPLLLLGSDRLPPLLDVLIVKTQDLPALRPEHIESVVDEGGGDRKLLGDVTRWHSGEVAEEHPALLLVLLEMALAETDLGQRHPVLQPLPKTGLLLVAVP